MSSADARQVFARAFGFGVLQSCVEQLSGAVSTEEDPPHARGLGGEVAPVRLRHRGVHDGVRVLA